MIPRVIAVVLNYAISIKQSSREPCLSCMLANRVPVVLNM